MKQDWIQNTWDMKRLNENHRKAANNRHIQSIHNTLLNQNIFKLNY